MSAPARLHISPAEALIDVPRQIQVQGLRPGEEVTLQSRTVRGPGVVWVAAARFQADATGHVDLGRDAPLPGSAYEGVDPMGLIWAQAPEQPGASREVFAAEPGGALHTRITLLRDGHTEADAPLVQQLAAPGGAGAQRLRRRHQRSPGGAVRLARLHRPGAGLLQGARPVGLHLEHPAGVLRDRLALDAPHPATGPRLCGAERPVTRR